MTKKLLSFAGIVPLLAVCAIAVLVGVHFGLLDHSLMPHGIGLAMTTLAANSPRSFELGDLNDLPVVQSDIIYEGAAVGDNGSGYARPLVAGDPFRGFATRKADNSAGANAAINVNVYSEGRIQLPVGSFAITDVGKPIYASDDDTFTLTEGTSSYVGRAVRFVATGTAVVEFDAGGPELGQVAELTDSSGGTASGTIAAVSGTFVQAEVANAIASLAARLNSVLRQIQ